MKNKNNQEIEKSKLNSNLDTSFAQSKTAQGILFAFLMLIFSPIYGVVKYPKGTVARKTYLRANIITLIVLIIVITIIAVVCSIFINLIVDITQGTTDAIIDGVVDGAKKLILLIK